MNHNIKERRNELVCLVEKAENLREELIQFKRKEGDYNSVKNLDYAESSLDDCITFLNRHNDEYLN